jgi:hypothetical protein
VGQRGRRAIFALIRQHLGERPQEQEPVPSDETCQHCGKDIVAHHARNLRCPEAKTIYQRRA